MFDNAAPTHWAILKESVLSVSLKTQANCKEDEISAIFNANWVTCSIEANLYAVYLESKNCPVTLDFKLYLGMLFLQLISHAETLSMSVLSKTPCNTSSQSYCSSSDTRIHNVNSKLVELTKLKILSNIFLSIQSVKLVPHISSVLPK